MSNDQHTQAPGDCANGAGATKNGAATAAAAATDDDDFTPSPRLAFHNKPKVSRMLLERAVSPFPLEVRASTICEGSGLFTRAEIESGREIYHVFPFMSFVDAGNDTICHFCLKDTGESFGRPAKAESSAQTRQCAACKVARYCSKDCQKSAWRMHHKEECKVLQRFPTMRAQNVLAHRLFFYNRSGKVSRSMLRTGFSLLETHFKEFAEDETRANDILEVALAISEAVGAEADMDLVWKMVPMMRINCVRMRPASKKESVGYCFELITAVINHSCEPNAYLYFEGPRIRLRSLRKIAAGEEITVCYVDPTLDLVIRKELLKRDYFFDCSCSRCTAELKLQRRLVGGGGSKLDPIRQAQSEIRQLMKSAVHASKYPGIYTNYEDLPTVETRLRTITSSVPFAADQSWPEDMDPLPLARLSLAMLYLGQGKPVPALRNALKGKFLSPRRSSGPEFVNEMLDVITVLLVAGSLPPDAPAFEDKTFPSLESIRAVTYGYIFAVCRQSSLAFGSSEYTEGVHNLMNILAAKKHSTQSGSKQLTEEYRMAQRQLLAWAGVPLENGLMMPGHGSTL